jgi:hypothetical protein
MMKPAAQIEREILEVLHGRADGKCDTHKPRAPLATAHVSLAAAHEHAAKAYECVRQGQHAEAARSFRLAAGAFLKAGHQAAKQDPKQAKIAKGRSAAYEALAKKHRGLGARRGPRSPTPLRGR